MRAKRQFEFASARRDLVPLAINRTAFPPWSIHAPPADATGATSAAGHRGDALGAFLSRTKDAGRRGYERGPLAGHLHMGDGAHALCSVQRGCYVHGGKQPSPLPLSG